MKTLLLGLSALLLVTACAEPKKSRGRAESRGARTASPGASGGPVVAASCQDMYSWGGVFNGDDNHINLWQDRINDFTSGWLAPDDVGTVDPGHGVRFCGQVCRSGRDVSQIYVGISDSLFRNGEADNEITIDVKHGQNGGQYVENSSSWGRIAVFSDAYGAIKFEGQIRNDGKFVGTFYYQNYHKFDPARGELSPIQGSMRSLGDFVVPADRFWREGC